MNEEQYRKWDIIIKGVITPIIAVITVLVGIYQYTDGQRKSVEKEFELRKLERQQARFEEKAILYKEARRILSFLSTSDEEESKTFHQKKDRFWELYWGDLAAVESKQIETLMVKFGRGLSKLEKGVAPETVQKELKKISLAFSRQAQKELTESDVQR